MPQQPVMIIAGPTASGKSALALEWAKTRNGVIINADSMQVYRGLCVITAMPTLEEQAHAPHRLYGYRDPAEPCSVAQWLSAARIAVYETWQEDKLPILVGGTGMYLNALMHGIAEIPDIAPDIRQHVRTMEAHEAYAWLQEHDAAMAEKLKPNDAQRVKRAVEVMQQTGRSLQDWQCQTPLKPIPDALFECHLLSPPREILYGRCNARFLTMMEHGALDEVRALHARHLHSDLPAMRAVGVPELSRHLKGEWALEQAIAQAQQATRRYAKRQMTWFRHQYTSFTYRPSSWSCSR